MDHAAKSHRLGKLGFQEHAGLVFVLPRFRTQDLKPRQGRPIIDLDHVVDFFGRRAGRRHVHGREKAIAIGDHVGADRMDRGVFFRVQALFGVAVDRREHGADRVSNLLWPAVIPPYDVVLEMMDHRAEAHLILHGDKRARFHVALSLEIIPSQADPAHFVHCVERGADLDGARHRDDADDTKAKCLDAHGIVQKEIFFLRISQMGFCWASLRSMSSYNNQDQSRRSAQGRVKLACG